MSIHAKTKSYTFKYALWILGTTTLPWSIHNLNQTSTLQFKLEKHEFPICSQLHQKQYNVYFSIRTIFAPPSQTSIITPRFFISNAD